MMSTHFGMKSDFHEQKNTIKIETLSEDSEKDIKPDIQHFPLTTEQVPRKHKGR